MMFIKRHKILFIIFIISIFLIIKNSSIPYLFVPPAFISFIFDRPRGEFFSGVAQIVDIFASAYATSLLFYYIVEYIPAIKREKKANIIAKPQLSNLYFYISELLAMLKYSAKQQNLWDYNNPDTMDELIIQNRVVMCNRRSFKNEIEDATIPYSYNLL